MILKGGGVISKMTGFFFVLMLLGCERGLLNNRLDDLALTCGTEALDASLGTQFFRIDKGTSLFEKEDIQLFATTAEGIIIPVEFLLTRKNCIQVNSSKIPPQKFQISIIFKDRSAGFVNMNSRNDSAGFIEMQDCDKYCQAFPVCGSIEISRSIDGKLGRVFQVSGPRDAKLNATLDQNLVSTSIVINRNNCFVIPNDSNGKLSLQDNLGNFLETDSADLIRTHNKDHVSLLTLRVPLNPDEILCKGNPFSYRMEGGKCVPKSFKYICQDTPSNGGVALVSTYYMRPDCEAIDFSLKDLTELLFYSKSFSNVEVFSGLENLREIDLSVNYISSLKLLIGVPKLEYLNIIGNNIPFDISSIAHLTSLKRISLGNSKIVGLDLIPSFPNIEEIEIDSINIEILSKLPNLKKLIVTTDGNLDFNSFQNLSQLEDLKIVGGKDISNLGALVRFVNLKSLAFTSIGKFAAGEKLPVIKNLQTLTFETMNLPDLLTLSDFKKLTQLKINFTRISDRLQWPENRSVTLMEVTTFSGQDLDWLKVFQNLEDLTLNGGVESLSTLPALERLKRLNLDGINFGSLGDLTKVPNLESLFLGKYGSELDLAELPFFPHLQTFEYSRDSLSQYDLAWIKQLPNLNSLTLKLDLKSLIDGDDLPENLDFLSLTSSTLTNLDFLQKLHKLRSLSLNLISVDGLENHVFDLPYVKNVSLSLKKVQYSRMPVFSGALIADISLIGDESIEARDENISRFPHVKILKFENSENSLSLLSNFLDVETLELNSPMIDFSSLPEMANMHSLSLSTIDLENLSGIEKMRNLHEIEFVVRNNLQDISGLKLLSKLELIKNSRPLRAQFRTFESCPETGDFPIGIINYCRNIQKSLAPSFGPLPNF